MALSTPRIIGRDLGVTIATAKTIWDTVKIDFKFATEGATASDSVLDEDVFTTKRLSGTLTGYMGSVNNGTTLPAIGDAITDLAVKVGVDSTLPSLTAYTNIKVMDVSYDYSKGPAKFTVSFQSGMLN